MTFLPPSKMCQMIRKKHLAKNSTSLNKKQVQKLRRLKSKLAALQPKVKSTLWTLVAVDIPLRLVVDIPFQ